MSLSRYSLLWKLAALLVMFCLLIISLSGAWVDQIRLKTAFLSVEAKQVLSIYALEAERAAWAGTVDSFLKRMRMREQGLIMVVDNQLQPLSTPPFPEDLYDRLTSMRQLHMPMSRRSPIPPLIDVPFPNEQGHLAIQLPERFLPWEYQDLIVVAVRYLPPVILALLFGIGLYQVLIAPLANLSQQANALKAGQLGLSLDPNMARRQDELGELGRALQHMADRLQSSILQQRRLLRDLSHELRTPLGRLQVACEMPLSLEEWRTRVEREIGLMSSLVNSTLELAWLDTEQPNFSLEPVNVPALWDVLCEDARFESGWSLERFPCELPAHCSVRANLNGLARALENILRNAIRHSPAQGKVMLGGQRMVDGHWLLWIEDQGPGVPEGDLGKIFQPFTRLCADRPGGDGFGLGLAIAKRMITQQGGRLWAENTSSGLRLNLVLQSV